MGSSQNIWFGSNYLEVILLKLSLVFTRNMVCRYVLPFMKQILPETSINKSSPTFLKNKAYIATHVKSAFEKVKIYVVSDAEICDKVVHDRMQGDNAVKFIGLDCEWESSNNTNNGVSLIQISSGNDCILYRVSHCAGIIPKSLKNLMEDKNVLKFGVGIAEDVRRLGVHGVTVTGVVDLRYIAERCLPAAVGKQFSEKECDTSKWRSLNALASNVLDVKMNKSFDIRCGNWESDVLNPTQILYAAKDAIMSLEIFYGLILLRHRHSTSTLQGIFETKNDSQNIWLTECQEQLQVYMYSHDEDKLVTVDSTSQSTNVTSQPSPDFVNFARSLCQGLIERKYKQKGNNNSNKSSRNRNTINTNTNTASGLKGGGIRDKPLYENCILKGPNDAVLAVVNRQKVMWYVNKNLGEIICDEPLTLRLYFEPSGRPMPEADYYTTVKDNVCVVCESTENFVRKLIIPHDYKRHFPLEVKDHNSHDVLLLCLPCHRIADRQDEILRKQLAAEYNAPLGTKEHRMYVDNPTLKKVNVAAKVLLHHGTRIPEERAKELKSIVSDYCTGEEITDEVLKRLSIMNIKEKNTTYGEPHGKRVVDAFVRENRLAEFIRMWREHFLTNMQPKHLPPLWSVEHNLDKLDNLMVDKNNVN